MKWLDNHYLHFNKVDPSYYNKFLYINTRNKKHNLKNIHHLLATLKTSKNDCVLAEASQSFIQMFQGFIPGLSRQSSCTTFTPKLEMVSCDLNSLKFLDGKNISS